ncbi:hypothetical protein BDN72DRAFT_839680 [Pluteus cervinus]|uniref:Uncharacterized protein n=1 Tax=Pluteus cervinus TaxID=181527 RepID=A0ACD3AX62_9AGAR|nr:hypothetical protein BDN72DRAFT_839680 [Pluteus cervinus]
MAAIRRMHKPAKKWTSNDLLAYNIHIVDQDRSTFFGDPNLPASTAHPVFLNNVTAPPNSFDIKTGNLFQYLRRAVERTSKPPEAFVTEFLENLLRYLGYNAPGRLLTGRREITLPMCGKTIKVVPAITIAGDDGCDLVARAVKLRQDTSTGTVDSEPRLIAEAIAAFFEFQEGHRRIGNKVPNHREIPGIIMKGTAPVFYRIPITDDLVRSIGDGTYPDQPTTIHRLLSPVQDVSKYFSEGMQSLENRRVIVRCFEAFKRYLPPEWHSST